MHHAKRNESRKNAPIFARRTHRDKRNMCSSSSKNATIRQNEISGQFPVRRVRLPAQVDMSNLPYDVQLTLFLASIQHIQVFLPKNSPNSFIFMRFLGKSTFFSQNFLSMHPKYRFFKGIPDTKHFQHSVLQEI